MVLTSPKPDKFVHFPDYLHRMGKKKLLLIHKFKVGL